MVVRDTFLAELKTLFGLVVAGFEPGFSDPKARALPLRQSYAVVSTSYSVNFDKKRKKVPLHSLRSHTKGDI